MKDTSNTLKSLRQLQTITGLLVLIGLLWIPAASADSAVKGHDTARDRIESRVKGYVPTKLIPLRINHSYRWPVSDKVSLFYARKFNAVTVRDPSFGLILRDDIQKCFQVEYTISSSGNSLEVGTFIRF